MMTSSGWEVQYCSRWYLIVAFKRKGLEPTPKTTRVNLNGWISITSLLMSFTHRKRRTSWSPSSTAIMRKAFSMSAVSAIWYERNLIKMFRIFWLNFGSMSRQAGSHSGRIYHLFLQRHHRLYVAWLCLCRYGQSHGGASSVGGLN